MELPALLPGARSDGTASTRGESSTIAPMAAKSADLNGVAVSAEVFEFPRGQAACTYKGGHALCQDQSREQDGQASFQ